jgi:rubredoxin/redox-sensitive bicupin YhaK (pirin superfamily)
MSVTSMSIEVGEAIKQDVRFKRLICLGCGFLYDEEAGLPEHGLPAGTRWEAISEDWCCPDCGTPKHRFEMVELPYADEQSVAGANRPVPEPLQFVLRDSERAFHQYLSTGAESSYIGGHPNAVLSRHSSFNFADFQSGRAGFGAIRVFGEEIFSGAGCGYNIHPHHDFVICAFVLGGELTHINTVGNIDQLHEDDYYVFSAGSGGKHCEVNLKSKDMHVIYMWFLPDRLLLPPSYHRSRFDRDTSRNRIVTLAGNARGALPIPQDVRISRLVSDKSALYQYEPASPRHGVYVFVLKGSAECVNTMLQSRDSMGLVGGKPFAFQTDSEETDMLFVETIM